MVSSLSGELISAMPSEALEATASTNGLEIAGGESEVRGLVINRFPGVGIVIARKGQ